MNWGDRWLVDLQKREEDQSHQWSGKQFRIRVLVIYTFSINNLIIFTCYSIGNLLLNLTLVGWGLCSLFMVLGSALHELAFAIGLDPKNHLILYQSETHPHLLFICWAPLCFHTPVCPWGGVESHMWVFHGLFIWFWAFLISWANF